MKASYMIRRFGIFSLGIAVFVIIGAAAADTFAADVTLEIQEPETHKILNLPQYIQIQ